MTITAELRVIESQHKRRDLLRYGRTSCYHDFYNQNAVKKVQRIFKNSQNVGFLPQKVRHSSAKILLYAIQSPTKFNAQIAEDRADFIGNIDIEI